MVMKCVGVSARGAKKIPCPYGLFFGTKPPPELAFDLRSAAKTLARLI
jgi:hypothetical protein